MKVFVLASYSPSLITFRGELLKSMVGRGCEVHVVGPSMPPDSDLSKKLEKIGCCVHQVALSRAGMNPIYDVVYFLRILLLLIRLKPDFLLGYTIKPVVYGGAAAWFARIPYRFSLITGLGYAFSEQSSGPRCFFRFLVRRLYKFSLHRMNLVFFQNPDDESLFRELNLLSPKTPSCVVRGSGVDLACFPVVKLPDELGFLLIARLLGDKGVREYIAAAKEIKKSYPLVVFNLVGWIDENPDSISQSELDKWIEEGVITFHGKLADVRPAIESSSVYVLPSYREGTPRTVLEAMSMGRPIITTDAPGCRETVVDGYNGYLVPVKNVQALVNAMVSMIEAPDEVARMGANSRLIAEQKYDVHSVNGGMLERMGIN